VNVKAVPLLDSQASFSSSHFYRYSMSPQKLVIFSLFCGWVNTFKQRNKWPKTKKQNNISTEFNMTWKQDVKV